MNEFRKGQLVWCMENIYGHKAKKNSMQKVLAHHEGDDHVYLECDRAILSKLEGSGNYHGVFYSIKDGDIRPVQVGDEVEVTHEKWKGVIIEIGEDYLRIEDSQNSCCVGRIYHSSIKHLRLITGTGGAETENIQPPKQNCCFSCADMGKCRKTVCAEKITDGKKTWEKMVQEILSNNWLQCLGEGCSYKAKCWKPQEPDSEQSNSRTVEQPPQVAAEEAKARQQREARQKERLMCDFCGHEIGWKEESHHIVMPGVKDVACKHCYIELARSGELYKCMKSQLADMDGPAYHPRHFRGERQRSRNHVDKYSAPWLLRDWGR